MIISKSERELVYMRDAGRITAGALEEVRKAVQPGVTTGELDQVAESYIRHHGARPAFKGYHGFPGNICTSVTNEVVHGIPGLRKLENGDNVSIDIGAVINGYYGDAAITVPVGEVDADMQRLIDVTRECLYKGIAQAVCGNRLSDISHAVQCHAEAHGYGVVRDYVGHGIGTSMHEDPQVPNYGIPGHGPRLRPGMVLAIEPMINMGTYEVVTQDNGWTVVTQDGKPSAHWEHTVAITEHGPEILTQL